LQTCLSNLYTHDTARLFLYKYHQCQVISREGIWKHDLAKKVIPGDILNKAFEQIKKEFESQLVTYKGQPWNIAQVLSEIFGRIK
jgi:hypothetical protein